MTKCQKSYFLIWALGLTCPPPARNASQREAGGSLSPARSCLTVAGGLDLTFELCHLTFYSTFSLLFVHEEA
jgi:hypothetical protein